MNNVNILKQVYSNKKLSLIITAFTGFLFFFIYRKISIFILFVIINAVITYFWKLYHIPFDVSPFFFFEIVIAKYYNLWFVVGFAVFGYLLPKIMAGSGPDLPFMLLIIYSIFCCYLSTMIRLPLPFTGYIMCFVQYLGAVFINMIDKPPQITVLEGLPYLTNNLLWFLTFGEIISILFQ